MKRRLLVVTFLLIIVGNGVPLGLVTWDRSGPARSVTEFSVRELSWSNSDDENTGIALEWDWHRSSIDSVTEAKFDTLRLRCRPGMYGSSCSDSRRGYAVIGIDTSEWRADSANRVRALDSLRRIGSSDTTYRARELRSIGRESRLTVLDVALDRASLEETWGHGRLILPADLETWWYSEASPGSYAEMGRRRSITVHLAPSELYLPSSLRGAAREGPGFRWNDSVPESFATVTVGRGGLPRITSIRWSDTPTP